MPSVCSAVLLALHLTLCQSASTHLSSYNIACRRRQQAVSVAIWNDVPFHNEVWAGLLYSAQEAGATATAYVLRSSTWHMEKVIASWYTQPLRDSSDFIGDACKYDAILLPTFPEHHSRLLAELLQQNCQHQTVIVAVHNPSQLENTEYGASIGLLNQSHAHVLALAPHTVAATRAILGKHGLNISVDLFVPIFAIDTSCLEDEPGCVDADTRKGFVLQGLFANNRRDYQGLFDSIRGNTQLMADPAFQLSLIGKGELALPAGLASKVTKHDSLPYKDYYRLIQGSRGLLTAFASDVYNTVKASSSVTTALVCATPLVMTKEALAAYNFLTEDAVIISDGNDADAMQRALSLPDGAVEAKLSAVEAIRAKLSLRNQLLLMRKLMHGRSLCAAGQ